MTISRSPFRSNTNRPRGPGWAALGQAQHEKQGSAGTQHGKQGSVSKNDVDHYPSISKITSFDHTKYPLKKHAVGKSFSSVVRPSAEFPMLVGGKSHKDKSVVQDVQIVKEPIATPLQMLHDIHTWADQNLIEDILAAVNNDVDQASLLLEAMVSPQSTVEATSSGPSSSTANELSENNKCLSESNFGEDKISDEYNEAYKRLFSVPLEPEWEEDDIYISQRKDAIRMMRAASQHSRAASSAFSRGDHFSAQQYSLRAKEEWMEAEKLNNEAAEKILRIINNENDMSKIDLHGLHASEAVGALKEHLHKIESQPLMSRASSSGGLAKMEVGISRSSSCENVGQLLMNETEKRKQIPQAQAGPTILQVITGKGNHSKGQAALPSVIRSFLLENGYRFDDARAGVIAVRPKFRQKRE